MAYNDLFEDAAERLLDGIRTAQKLTLDAVERTARNFGAFVPRVALPLPFELPRPREIAESAFRFGERLAQTNKEFTLKLIDLLYPATSRSR
jgi:hypothetical protein